MLLRVSLPAIFIHQQLYRFSFHIWDIIQRHLDSNASNVTQIHFVPQDVAQREFREWPLPKPAVYVPDLPNISAKIYPLQWIFHAFGGVVGAGQDMLDAVPGRKVIHGREKCMILRYIDMGHTRFEES